MGMAALRIAGSGVIPTRGLGRDQGMPAQRGSLLGSSREWCLGCGASGPKTCLISIGNSNVFVIFLFSSANHPGHRTHGRSTRHNLLRATISHKAVEGRREAVFTAWDNPHGLASTHGGPPLHPLRGHQVFGPGAPHPKHRSLEEPSGGPHGAAGPPSLPNPLVRITPDPAVPRAPIPTPGRGRPPPPTLETTLDVSLPSQVSDQVGPTTAIFL